jgi:hypothetical protein
MELKLGKNRKSGGNRKHGRNKAKCEYYRTRSVRNKLRKLDRHLAVHVNDNVAVAARQRAATH